MPATEKTWTDRLFDSFERNYGTQRMAAYWAGQNMDEVKAEWDYELAKFDVRVRRISDSPIARAWQSWKYSGEPHPPTLPQFLKLCRSFRVEPEQPLLGKDEIPTADEQARANVAKIRSMVQSTIKRMPTGSGPRKVTVEPTDLQLKMRKARETDGLI